MNKQITIELAVGIIVLTALGFGAFAVLESRKVNAPANVPVFEEMQEEKTEMVNPASVYCQENGGKLEIRNNPDGSQTGYCKFSEGSECEEWAFMRGECKEDAVRNEDDISNWKTYKNEKFGFEFKYPKKFGDPIINGDDSLDIEMFDLEDRDKISKISSEFYELGFGYNAGLTIRIAGFSKEKPFLAECNEGYCSALNVFEEKNNINDNSKINIGNVIGYKKYWFGISGGYFIKDYVFFLQNYRITFSFDIFDLPRTIDYNLFSSKDEIKKYEKMRKNQSEEQLIAGDKNEERIDKIISTIKFTN